MSAKCHELILWMWSTWIWLKLVCSNLSEFKRWKQFHEHSEYKYTMNDNNTTQVRQMFPLHCFNFSHKKKTRRLKTFSVEVATKSGPRKGKYFHSHMCGNSVEETFHYSSPYDLYCKAQMKTWGWWQYSQISPCRLHAACCLCAPLRPLRCERCRFPVKTDKRNMLDETFMNNCGDQSSPMLRQSYATDKTDVVN